MGKQSGWWIGWHKAEQAVVEETNTAAHLEDKLQASDRNLSAQVGSQNSCGIMAVM